MVVFLRSTELFDYKLRAGDFLVAGGDASATAIREASVYVSSYSPGLDRDFADFGAFDTYEAHGSAKLFLGDCSSDWGMPVLHIGGRINIPFMSATLQEAQEYQILPAANTIWYAGARDYTREERDWARYNQRIFPLPEVELDAAVRTAVSDIGHQPFRVMINIDVLDPVWAPAVRHQASCGASPRDLFKAVKALAGSPVCVVQVCGPNPEEEGLAQTARIAAETARDVSLAIWG